MAVFDGLETAFSSILFDRETRERSREEQEDVAARLVIEAIRSYGATEKGMGSIAKGARKIGGAFDEDRGKHAGAETISSGSVLNGRIELGDELRQHVVGVKRDARTCSSHSSDVLTPPSSLFSSSVECALDLLLSGYASSVEISSGAVYVDAPRPGAIYLPGSFNPLHEGHTGLLEEAAKVLSNCRSEGHDATGGGCTPPWSATDGSDAGLAQPNAGLPNEIVASASSVLVPPPLAYFELSVANADKGTIDRAEVLKRIAQFTSAKAPLMLTREPLFARKAAVLRTSGAGEGVPGPAFAVGYDTAIRLVNPKYYDGKMDNMLIEVRFGVERWCGGRKRKKGSLKGPCRPNHVSAIEGVPGSSLRHCLPFTT